MAVTRQRSVGASVCVLFATFLRQQTCAPAPAPESSTDAHDNAIAQAALWLRDNAVPFSRVDLSENLDDLEPLRQMIGSARIVSLGEGTHGTNEFFQMKGRILRFLVERMGFTAFAMEATWPESNRLDRYVRTGEGQPDVLLSGLYFWTWNTTSVLDMIKWMRSHNAGGGSLGFYGFDMQFPGMAIQNVTQYIGSVDPPAVSEFTQHFDCLARYANDSWGRFPTPGYGDQTSAYRDACYTDLNWVQTALLERRARYEAASSASAWTFAVQSARVAQQYEWMISKRQDRDASMAENVRWLVDQMPPTGKIVLWAHNGHVYTVAPSMGQALRQSFGSQMVVVGFSFGSGSFTAITLSGSASHGLATQTVGDPVRDSYEDYFLNSGIPRFILDLRNRNLSASNTSWLAGPRLFRSIGAGFDPADPSSFYYQANLPNEFDIMIFFDRTNATQVLPFNYPSQF